MKNTLIIKKKHNYHIFLKFDNIDKLKLQTFYYLVIQYNPFSIKIIKFDPNKLNSYSDPTKNFLTLLLEEEGDSTQNLILMKILFQQK